MKRPSLENYQSDKYYPAVVKAVARILSHSDIVAPAEVFMEMGKLSWEDWDVLK
jgi:hypothetical protein